MDETLRQELMRTDLGLRDAPYLAALVPTLDRFLKVYFRSEVRGMERVPPEGGALLVSNHSGGLMSMDVPILVAAFVAEFGPERPLYVLAHDAVLDSPVGGLLKRCGFLADTPENTDAVLDAGAVTIVFPGGDYDRSRPTFGANVIDFAGSTGYVRTALRSGVPIVPVVSTGGQQGQLHLSRGRWLAGLTGLDRRRRRPYLPISIGFPFGLSIGLPPNLPLPTKITTEVLGPVHVAAEFGADPDVAEVDAVVRGRMQQAIDDLARRRRLPVLG